jgi:hypothetical protein
VVANAPSGRLAQWASRGSISPEGTGRTYPLIEYMVISLGRARRPCSDRWNLVSLISDPRRHARLAGTVR